MYRSKLMYRRWLENLPPDEPFCRLFNCPLEEFDKTWTQDLRGWVGDFTELVDGGTTLWHKITPAQALDILAQV